MPAQINQNRIGFFIVFAACSSPYAGLPFIEHKTKKDSCDCKLVPDETKGCTYQT